MADDERTEDAADEARENAHEPSATPDNPVVAAAIERFPDVIAEDSAGQPVAHVPREQWREFAEWLRDEQQFEVCVDVCAVDHLLNRDRRLPAGVPAERFDFVANFLSRANHGRLRAIAQVPAGDPTIASLTPVYPSVDYSERETFDLFGIVFEGHPGLERILLPDDWEGHPLRKDAAAAAVPVQFKGPKTTPFQRALPKEDQP
ncbi:MAG: NADH-quinone oxidoreductase subunit C [Actinobacteria bacterium]|nr:NADH-quinone oxidoreductase subunit C [Actinomycetota bacterium]